MRTTTKEYIIKYLESGRLKINPDSRMECGKNCMDCYFYDGSQGVSIHCPVSQTDEARKTNKEIRQEYPEYFI
jgi:hypothetical protein